MGKYQVYPAYKDSGVEWLGKIPNAWKTVKLSYILKLQSGETITSEKIKEIGQYPVYGGNGLRGFTSTFNCDGAHVLIGRQGALCGNINLAQGKFYASEHALVVYPFIQFNITYLSSLLETMDLGQYSVSAAQPGISVERLNLLKVSIPPLEEQNTIGHFLDHETARIDTLIAKQESLIALLKEKRQAVISHAVTKGLDPDVPMKDSGVEWLGEVPAHWVIMPLKQAIVLQRGHDLPSDNRQAGDIPVISSGGPIALHNEAKAKGPGIVTGRYGTIGEFYYVAESKYWPLNTSLYSVETYDNYVRYLWYMLQNMKHLFVLHSSKSAVPGVDRNDLHREIIGIPADILEQKNIVAYLDTTCKKIDALIDKCKIRINLAKERRTALISAAVTGKIDVRDWTPPEPQIQREAVSV